MPHLGALILSEEGDTDGIENKDERETNMIAQDCILPQEPDILMSF